MNNNARLERLQKANAAQVGDGLPDGPLFANSDGTYTAHDGQRLTREQVQAVVARDPRIHSLLIINLGDDSDE